MDHKDTMHLYIHNIVPGVSLSHENHHYTKLIAQNLQFRANYLDAGSNPFYMELFGFWVLYIKYLMSIPIMVLLSLLLRIKLHDILK